MAKRFTYVFFSLVLVFSFLCGSSAQTKIVPETIIAEQTKTIAVNSQLVEDKTASFLQLLGALCNAQTCWGEQTKPTSDGTPPAKVELFTEENSSKTLNELIKGAKNRIWIEMYTLTDGIHQGKLKTDQPYVLNSLKDAAKRGVKISIILDLKQHNKKDYNTLDKFDADDRKVMINFERDIEKYNRKDHTCLIKWQSKTLHRKVCLIDNDKVWIGSSNFTYSGLHKGYNIEMNLLITDAILAKQVATIIDNGDWDLLKETDLSDYKITNRASFEKHQ